MFITLYDAWLKVSEAFHRFKYPLKFIFMYLQCITDDYYKVLPVFNVLHHVFQRCDCMLAPKEEVRALWHTTNKPEAPAG